MNVCMLIRSTGYSEQKGRETLDCFNLHIAMKSSYSRDIQFYYMIMGVLP